MLRAGLVGIRGQTSYDYRVQEHGYTPSACPTCILFINFTAHTGRCVGCVDEIWVSTGEERRAGEKRERKTILGKMTEKKRGITSQERCSRQRKKKVLGQVQTSCNRGQPIVVAVGLYFTRYIFVHRKSWSHVGRGVGRSTYVRVHFR